MSEREKVSNACDSTFLLNLTVESQGEKKSVILNCNIT